MSSLLLLTSSELESVQHSIIDIQKKSPSGYTFFETVVSCENPEIIEKFKSVLYDQSTVATQGLAGNKRFLESSTASDECLLYIQMKEN